MVNTGQAEVPVWRSEGVRTAEDCVQHEQLGTVEDDPGDVADDEHDHNADQHSREVQFATDSSVGGLVVSVSVNKTRKISALLCSTLSSYLIPWNILVLKKTRKQTGLTQVNIKRHQFW